VAVEPRWLDRDRAAEYISVDPHEMRSLERRGKLPPASYHLGPRSPRWDRHLLDAAFEGGMASTNPRQAVTALVQEILAQPDRLISK
jgi:hypothetical protein